MATSRAPTKTWVAREGELYLGRDDVVFRTNATLSSVFLNSGVVVAAATKNITVTPPETGWEKQDLLGQNSNGFQNQLLDEKPVGMATVTGTLVLGEDETLEDFALSGTVTSPSGYTRYSIGRNNDTVVKACITVADSTNGVSFGFDNARFTKWGDVRIAGPDGHWEQDFTIICLTKDFNYEFRD